MGVTWQTSGAVHPGRFTLHSDDNPTLAWATGMLSYTDTSVHEFFERSKVYAEMAVANRSRVDTGLMRHMADSLLHVRPYSYELLFGWDEGAPHYAPYQEFGVPSHNIEAMLAVGRTFEELRAQLPGAIAG